MNRYRLFWVAQQKTLPLPDQGEVVLGRKAGHADIVLPVPTVSSRHARLWWEGDTLWVEDLGSTNGTFLNGKRLATPAPLRPGDELRLGKQVVLRVQAAETPGAAEQGAAASGAVASSEDEATVREASSQEASAGIAPNTRAPSAASATILGTDVAAVLAESAEKDTASAPWLVISLPGKPSKSHILSQPEITLGSAPDNTVVLPPELPPHYARLRRLPAGGYRWETIADAPRPRLRGKPAPAAFDLRGEDEILIPLRGALNVRLLYHLPSGAALSTREGEILFGNRDVLTIGRAPDNDVVLDSPVVSRHHAIVRREGERFFLRDLHTPNGTFVNGRRVGRAWLKPGDQVRIGPYRFVVGGQGLAQYAETGGVWLAAVGLNQWVRKDLNILQNVSLTIEPQELVVIVGQSGSGKTTLLNALSGFAPASQGEVVVNGVNIYRHFDAVRHHIGYVPQQDIIHKELTVWEALDYAARLRMPPDTTTAERHARIEEVLNDLDLAHRRDVPIARLSGGQQKRVSIGVELLTRPGLFFLDEPTSGLDPGTEKAFMHLLRRLADQGCTIVLVTHTTKNVDLADKVVFMARGGYLAWYGPPQEALAYFDRYRTPEEKAQGAMTFDDIYMLLDDPQRGDAATWAKRFREHEAYRQYITAPLQAKQNLPDLDEDARKSLMISSEAAAAEAARARRAKKPLAAGRSGFFHQTAVLFSRNIRVLLRDRFGLVLMLVVAPLVASLDFLLAALLGNTPFDFYTGNFSTAMITLFSLTVYAVMVGSLAQMREIVKEGDIYRRERLVNLRVLPYVLSKFGVAVVMAFYQAAWYVGLHYLAFHMPGGWQETGLIYITLTLTALGGMMLGLFSSALAPNANTAPLIVILFMVPQIVLSGAEVPLPNAVSATASTRWGFEGLMSITGIGSDVAADACWHLPLRTRALMSVEDKTATCRCMGLNLLDPHSCNFPGLGKYALPEASAPRPVPPVKPGDPPSKPALPPPPEAPKPPADSVAMARYLAALQAYQDEVKALQEAYQAELTLYQSRVNIYSAQMYAYQHALVRWEMGRALALGPAEGMLAHVQQDYGWTFVDKHKPNLYWRKIALTWGGEGVIIVVLFLAVWVIQVLKERMGK